MLSRRQMSEKRVLAFLCVTALLLLLEGCSAEQPRETPSVVRIGTMGDAVDYAPYMVARAQGWFEEEFRKAGVQRVEYTSFQALPALNESLGTERIDIAFEAGPPAIVGRAAGIDVRIVGVSCRLTQEIIVLADSAIQTIQDLRGTRLAVPAGTSSHFNVLKILGSSGLTEQDLEIIDMTPPDARNAFETGAVDAWAVWPPWPEQQIVAGTGRALPLAQAQIYSFMSFRGSFADDHPELASIACRVFNRAKSWVSDRGAESQKTVAESLNLSPDIVALAWPKHDWTADLTDETLVTDMQEKATFLFRQGVIRVELDVANHLLFPAVCEN